MMLYTLKSLKNLLFNIENLKNFLPSGRFYTYFFHDVVATHHATWITSTVFLISMLHSNPSYSGYIHVHMC